MLVPFITSKPTCISNKEGEMLMTRKIFTLFSLILSVAFVLAACGPAATSVPETAAPATSVPDTAVPPTAVPPTAVPPTAVPPTAVPTAEPVIVEWWHITTQDPGLTLWQTMADEYMAAHPNVKINITVLENEAFKTKLTTVMQGGTPPALFQSWGGGVMNDQANAGLLQDITSYLDADGGAWRNSFASGALAVYALNGKNYGVPWDMGMVGWWYNKDLFP